MPFLQSGEPTGAAAPPPCASATSPSAMARARRSSAGNERASDVRRKTPAMRVSADSEGAPLLDRQPPLDAPGDEAPRPRSASATRSRSSRISTRHTERSADASPSASSSTRSVSEVALALLEGAGAGSSAPARPAPRAPRARGQRRRSSRGRAARPPDRPTGRPGPTAHGWPERSPARPGEGVLPVPRPPSSGSRTMKAEPAPGLLSTRIVPPWASTICREMYRPIPKPP
jgi:hypothetical protein